VRDYFYVQDAVNAYLRLAEHMPDKRFVGQAFNFGNNTPMSALEVVKLVLQLTKKTSLNPKVLNEATHEIPRQYLDCSKARRMLDWQPLYSMQEALFETIDWYRSRFANGSSPSNSPNTYEPSFV
jgi:CDP-glucose 4,6-dehydratase